MPAATAARAVPIRRRPGRGLVLIEQIAVVTLLGSAAALTLPRLQQVHALVQDKALTVLAAQAGSALALNAGACLLSGQQAGPGRCQPVRDCRDAEALLQQPLPPGYVIAAQPLQAEGSRCQLVRQADGAIAGFHGQAAGRL